MTAAANRALIARSEAMNRKYRLGIYSRAPKGTKALMLRSEALNRKYHLGRYRTVPQSVTAAANRALIPRSEGMNEKYRLGPSAPAQVVTAPDFSWSAFGIGATAMLAFVLLASGAILGARHGWRTPRTPISS
jgi:hypothetical protein